MAGGSDESKREARLCSGQDSRSPDDSGAGASGECDKGGVAMNRKLISAFVIALVCLLLAPATIDAQRSRGGKHSSSTHSRSYQSRPRSSASHYRSSSSHQKKSAPSIRSTTTHRKSYVTGVQRDSHGKIKRSELSKRQFMKQTGYPHGRPGYVIDHIIPLANGGRDDPSNMQWQTKADAKAKDKWERGQTSKSKRK